jgi:hypothetical protein
VTVAGSEAHRTVVLAFWRSAGEDSVCSSRRMARIGQAVKIRHPHRGSHRLISRGATE